MIKVLVKDDHAIMTSAIQEILKLAFESPEVTIENDDKRFMACLDKGSFNLVITDFHALGASPLDFIINIKIAKPSSRILVLSRYPADKYAQLCIDAGACAYLEKTSNFEEYKEAMISVSRGEFYIELSNT